MGSVVKSRQEETFYQFKRAKSEVEIKKSEEKVWRCTDHISSV